MKISPQDVAKSHIALYIQAIAFIFFFYIATEKLYSYCNKGYSEYTECFNNHPQLFYMYIAVTLIAALQLSLTLFMERYFFQLGMINANIGRTDCITIAVTIVISNIYFSKIPESITNLEECAYLVFLYFIIMIILFTVLMRREISIKSPIFKNEIPQTGDIKSSKENFAFSIPMLYIITFAFTIEAFLCYLFYTSYSLKWKVSKTQNSGRYSAYDQINETSSTIIIGIIITTAIIIYLINVKKKVIIYEKGI